MRSAARAAQVFQVRPTLLASLLSNASGASHRQVDPDAHQQPQQPAPYPQEIVTSPDLRCNPPCEGDGLHELAAFVRRVVGYLCKLEPVAISSVLKGSLDFRLRQLVIVTSPRFLREPARFVSSWRF